jgi:hypothetical protein
VQAALVWFLIAIATAFGLPAISFLTMAAVYIFVGGLFSSTKFGFVQLVSILGLLAAGYLLG